jgi:hypothetical protein
MNKKIKIESIKSRQDAYFKAQKRLEAKLGVDG